MPKKKPSNIPCSVEGCQNPKDSYGLCTAHRRRQKLYGDPLGKKDITGENNWMWKGEKVGYTSLHSWVKRRLNKPKECQDCGEEKRLDLANISQEYKRDITDWEWLCRKCHMTKDGRGEKLRFTRPHTAETKEKIGAHFRGKKLSPEHVAKVVAKLNTPETRKLISEGVRRHWQKKREAQANGTTL